MNPAARRIGRLGASIALTLSVLLAGCSGVQPRKPVPPVPLHTAQTEIPEDELLDVGILVFDSSDLREDDNGRDDIPISPQTREAEARFVPYHLKNTLQRTGEWGAVRVLPAETRAVDVMVTGRLISSDGESMEVSVEVRDASGRSWYTRTYDAEVTEQNYAGLGPGETDVFQNLYNEIANDMLAYRRQLGPVHAKTVRSIAMLTYAEELAPEAFGGYLRDGDDGSLRIIRLPARNDPMMERMLQIREREYTLIDTVNDYYDNFYLAMWDPYRNWRKYYREESIALQEVKRKELTRKALGVAAVLGAIALEVMGQSGSILLATGGVLAYKSGMDVGEEAEIHEGSIRELDTSFNAEVAPLVMEVDGKVVTLQGSAEAQFREWRRLLRELYVAETGFTQDRNKALQGPVSHSDATVETGAGSTQ